MRTSMNILIGIQIVMICALLILIGTTNLYYFDPSRLNHEEQSVTSLIEEDYSQYEVGFNDGLTCMTLLNLELQLSNERKAFGEMQEICRYRYLRREYEIK